MKRKALLLLLFCCGCVCLHAQTYLVCPEDITIECGEDSLPLTTGHATWYGNSTVTLNYEDSASPDCGANETIARTWRATINSSVAEECVQLISSIDTTPPIITCPADVIIAWGEEENSANCGVATGSDTCGIVIITESSVEVGSNSDYKIITRTWSVTDECGNQTKCDQIITVGADSNPAYYPLSLECPADITMSAREFFEDPLNAGEAQHFNGCSDPIYFYYTDEFLYEESAVQVRRRWRIKDDCNSRNCYQDITLIDWTAPEITCPEDIELLYTQDIDPQVTGRLQIEENVGPIQVSMTDEQIESTYENRNILRTWTASNVLDQESSCQQKIKIINPGQYLNVYPNPTQGWLEIRELDLEDFTISIYNAQGRLLQRHKKAFGVDVSKLNPGLYYLTIGNERRTYANRLFFKE